MSMFWITEKLEMLFLPLVIKLKFTVFIIIVFGAGGKVSYFERKEQSNKQKYSQVSGCKIHVTTEQDILKFSRGSMLPDPPKKLGPSALNQVDPSGSSPPLPLQISIAYFYFLFF